MSIYQRGKAWHADITIPGRPRFRGALGTTDKATAQRLHDEIKASLYQKQTAGHTWYEAIKSWMAVQERSEPERRILLAYDPGDIPLTEITAESFKIGHHKPATYRRYKNVFSAILSHAVSLGWLDKAPTFVARKTPPGRIRWLTSDEITRLFAELPEHLEAPALFALSTGLRQSNVLDLEWSRVDETRKLAWVSAEDMKNRHAHGVPLSSNALVALQMARGGHERWVFTYRGQRIEKIKGAWNRALSRAGIEDFTWHDLRHCWATQHIMNGTPIEVLQRLGGWKDLSMVMRYAHLAPGYLAQYADNHVTKLYTDTSRPHSSVDRALPS